MTNLPTSPADTRPDSEQIAESYLWHVDAICPKCGKVQRNRTCTACRVSRKKIVATRLTNDTTRATL